MRFDVLEVGLELIRSLRGPVQRLRSRDPDLYRQVRREASSICLNSAEGGERLGKDRLHLLGVARGSAKELRAALRVAEAWGDLQEREIAEPLELLDRVLAMLWRLTH